MLMRATQLKPCIVCFFEYLSTGSGKYEFPDLELKAIPKCSWMVFDAMIVLLYDLKGVSEKLQSEQHIKNDCQIYHV